MKINSIQLEGLLNENQLNQGINKVGGPTSGVGFDNLVSEKLTEVSDQIQSAQKMSEEYLTEGKHELHEVLIGLESANLSFQFVGKVRDKALEAYQEVMRLQI